MKNKRLVVIIFVSLIITLLGCSSISDLGIPPLPTPQVSDFQPDASVEETGADIPVEYQIPEEDESKFNQVMISVQNSVPEYIFDPNNTDDEENLILTFLAERPVVFIENNKEASEKINDFFVYMDEEIITGDDYGIGLSDYPGKNKMINLATDNYQVHVDYKLDNRLDFAFSHTVDVLRCDSQVISLMFTDYTFTGEGAGEYCKYAVSIDTESGDVFNTEYFTSVESMKDVLGRAVSALGTEQDWVERLIDSDDYLEILAEMTEFGNWFINNEGLVFLFAEDGDVQSASGIHEIFVPFEDCSAQVIKTYTLSSTKEGIGEISVEPGDYDTDIKNIADLIYISEYGETLFLDIKGTVYDVVLSSVQYSDTDSKFYPITVLWAGNYLTDSMLQVQTVIPDGMPNLMISYLSDGIIYRKLLSDSGKDGSPILVSDSINAVG